MATSGEMSCGNSGIANEPNDIKHNPSKKAQRKQKRYFQVLASKKAKRKERRRKKKIIKRSVPEHDPNYITKRQKKEMISRKLDSAIGVSPKVVIDFSFANLMSAKEKSRLANQLRRVYGSNRAAKEPFDLFFLNLDKSSEIYKICMNKNDGFEGYRVYMSNETILDKFSKEDLVYLSPDSSAVMHSYCSSKIYVIGGLVDETVSKNQSLQNATKLGIKSERLPIKEHLTQQGPIRNCILSINQVFDILLSIKQDNNWNIALQCGVPKRKQKP